MGGRSLFQHTHDRAARLCDADHITTLVARATGVKPGRHWTGGWGTVLLQPHHRETAAEVFLSLTHVKARDPLATVVIYPSDHFVYPEHRFLDWAKRARLVHKEGSPLLLQAFGLLNGSSLARARVVIAMHEGTTPVTASEGVTTRCSVRERAMTLCFFCPLHVCIWC